VRKWERQVVEEEEEPRFGEKVQLDELGLEEVHGGEPR
jgi:hypothetical protein